MCANRRGPHVQGHLIVLSPAGKLSSALCFTFIRCDTHNDQEVVARPHTTQVMNEEELQSLEVSGGLKRQDMTEAFKTPEGKAQCRKHFGRFELLISILNCLLLY